jgi:hypothetical protein
MIPIEVVRALRSERLERIRTNDLPVPLLEGPKVVLHSIPVRRDPYSISVDVGTVERDSIAPLGCVSTPHRVYDFDGVIGIQPGPRNSARGYALLFRMGMIEACDTRMLGGESLLAPGDHWIPSALVEAALIVAARQFLALQDSLGILAPIGLCVSVIGAKGLWLTTQIPGHNAGLHPISHEELLFPEVIVRDLKIDPMTVLRGTFDQLWNAAGLGSCADYVDQRWLVSEISALR